MRIIRATARAVFLTVTIYTEAHNQLEKVTAIMEGRVHMPKSTKDLGKN